MLDFYKTTDCSSERSSGNAKSCIVTDLKIIDVQLDQVIAFERKNDGRHIVVLLNFNATKVSVTLADGLLPEANSRLVRSAVERTRCCLSRICEPQRNDYPQSRHCCCF